MSVQDVVVGHIAAAKAELLKERVKIDAALNDLDRLLRTYASADSMPTAALQGGIPESVVTGSYASSGTEVKPIIAMTGTNTMTVGSDGTPQMRDAILAVVRDSGPVKADDAASELAERYRWSKASVRSLLAKMARAGDIAKVGRGLYDDITRVVGTGHTEASGGEDAEAPAGTGASVSEEPEEGSSRKEGGSDDSGTEPPFGRDDSVDAELRHGHGDRAPLVGVSG